jgi:cytochrome c oxidase subunit 2
MRSQTIVMPQGDFDKWLKDQTKATGSTDTGAAGAAVFKNNGCGACHTLTAAKASGKVGPDLDKLPTYAKSAGQELSPFIHESIVNPSAYVEKGFPANTMPPFSSLPKAQLDALVQYLIDSSQKG